MKRIILTFHPFDPQVTKPRTYNVEFEGTSHLIVSTKHGKIVEKMALFPQPDGTYRNEHGTSYKKVAPDRRPKPYAIHCREEDRGKPEITKFATLKEVQEYVKGRWQGPEYIDSPTSFHSDYCRYYLKNCSVFDLGHRGTNQVNADGYFDWTWEELS
jgi:hypothetical protein